MSHLLAADIGGTKTIMALAARARPWSSVVEERTYATGICLRLAAELKNAGFIPVSEPTGTRIAAPSGNHVLDSDAVDLPANSPRA